MTRYGLRDDQWERIKDLLTGKPGDVGATARDNRRFVGAVLYRYRAEFPGATCRSGSATGRTRTNGSVAGPRAEYGSGSFNTWQPTPTTNTR
jgi:hypothetical protein